MTCWEATGVGVGKVRLKVQPRVIALALARDHGETVKEPTDETTHGPSSRGDIPNEKEYHEDGHAQQSENCLRCFKGVTRLL